MAPYRVQTSDRTETLFEDAGFDRNAVIVPTLVGIPSDGVTPEAWQLATKQMLDMSEVDPLRDAALIAKLARS